MGAEKTTIQVKIECSVDRQDQRGVWSLCLQVEYDLVGLSGRLGGVPNQKKNQQESDFALICRLGPHSQALEPSNSY